MSRLAIPDSLRAEEGRTASFDLSRTERAPDGRWTVDAWAPLDGRTINGGIRLMF